MLSFVGGVLFKQLGPLLNSVVCYLLFAGRCLVLWFFG